MHLLLASEGMQNQWFLEWGSKWTRLQRWGRNQLGFILGVENGHRFSASTEIDLFWCGGQN